MPNNYGENGPNQQNGENGQQNRDEFHEMAMKISKKGAGRREAPRRMQNNLPIRGEILLPVANL